MNGIIEVIALKHIDTPMFIIIVVDIFKCVMNCKIILSSSTPDPIRPSLTDDDEDKASLVCSSAWNLMNTLNKE